MTPTRPTAAVPPERFEAATLAPIAASRVQPTADAVTAAVPASPAEPAPVVAVDHVGHRFGTNMALDDLSFEVPDGAITVLLGPNGAGKTTAIRAITGAIAPMWGAVSTFRLDPDDDGHLVRPRCGVVSAKPALYDRLTGRDNLAYAAELYDVGRGSDAAERIEECAARFGISDALDQMVGGYSTGMKTRLALARSVLHDPQLLLYDEPTSGLDPESSYAVLDMIREMTSFGHTVVMCTHLLGEAEGLADHIVMMEAGTALISGSPTELTHRYWPNPILTLDAEDTRLLDRSASFPGVAGYRRDPSGVRLEVDDLRRVPDIVASLIADGIRLTRVDPHVPTLEDLYFTIRREAGVGALGAGIAPITTGHGTLPTLGTTTPDAQVAPATVPPPFDPALLAPQPSAGHTSTGHTSGTQSTDMIQEGRR
jgi:ABC-2 type transport system ATP-binding protein